MGNVVTEDQNPVPSATVSYMRVPDIVRDSEGHLHVLSSSQVNSIVGVDPTGAFSLTGLVNGDYYLCASSSDATLIRSCDWATTQAINISAGISAGTQTLVLRKGSWLYLNVSDPNGHLSTPYIFGAGVITADGYYKPFQLSSNAAGIATYQLLVPPDASMALIVDTPLTVSDGSGQIPTRVPSRVIQMIGQATLTLAITID